MKRSLLQQKGVFALLLALLAGLGTAYAYSFSAVCPTGQTLYYNITDATNHYVEITCPGTSGASSWNGYTKPTGNITLPSTVTYNSVTYIVTSIGNDAFYECSDLTGTLTIPSSVNTIGNDAFHGCSGFTGSLTIPNSVNTIGELAFAGCSGFNGSLTISNSVTTIGYGAFGWCPNFTGTLTLPNSLMAIEDFSFYDSGFSGSLTIPNTVTSIGECAFGICSFTGSLTLGNSLTSIGEYAFAHCSGFTGSLTIPNSVTTIGADAFYDCEGFTGLALGNSVTTIGNSAFNSCSSLSGPLTIPNSVTTIGEGAFNNCLQFNGTLVIGTGVTSMGTGAFRYCSRLTSIIVLPETPPTLGTDVFANALMNIPVTVPCGSMTAYQTASGWNAFTNMLEDCDPLTYSINPDGVSVTVTGHVDGTDATGELFIPEIKVIDGVAYTVTAIGNNAFSSCSGLTGSLIIPNTVTSIGDFAFSVCTGLTGSLILPNTLTYIGAYAFQACPGFTGDLTLPNTLTTLGNGAFYLCDGFNGNLTLPNSITTIGKDTFADCKFIGSLTIPNAVNTVGDLAFSGCSGFDGTLTIGTGVTSIGNSAFYGCNHFTHVNYNAVNCANVNSTAQPFENCTGTITIGNTVQRIPANLFYQCTGLTGPLTIPNSVTEIGEGAFAYCDGFTGDLTIGKYVTSMGDNAFRDCTGFTHLNYNAIHSADLSSTDHENIPFKNFSGTLSIGDEVQRIPRCMFYDCVGLTGSLTIPSSVTSIGYGAFYRCTHFTSLYLGNSLTTIDVYAFYNCYRMTNALTIPESVTTIDYAAFADCYGFTSLTIGSNVTTIGNNAFSYCGGLGSITVRAETPPTLSTDGSFAFDDVPMDIPVYVPCGSISDYRAANGWSTFTNYQCIPWTVNLTANPWGGGYVDFTDSNGTNGHYSNGTTCTVLATPHDDYLFMHWSKNGTVVSSNPSYSFNVYEDTDLEAVFMALSDAGDIIGESTGTNAYLPSFSYYNYSLTEQIYTADELNGISTITSISFFNEGPTKTRTLSIYLMPTNKAAFSSTTDWISANLSNVAFGGSVTMRSGMWTTITLSRPFVYNGSSNLILIVDDNTGDYSYAPHMTCRVYGAPSQALRVFGDYTDFDPMNPPVSYSSNEYADLLDVKNQIMLNRVAYNIDATSADETAGTVSGGGQYGQGDLCSLKATPNTGYTFLSWSDSDGTVITTEAEYSFFVTQNRTLVANFLTGTDVCSLTFDLYDSYGDGWNDNYLVVDLGDGVSQRLTVTADMAFDATYTLPVVNGSHVDLGWIQGSYANECFFKVRYSNENIVFVSIDVDLNSNFEYGFDVDCNEMPANWAFLGYDDNGGSNYLPSHSFYKYSMSQQIYIADEIGSEGNITSIAFYNENYGDDDNTKTRNYDIYLKATNKYEFFTGTDWISVTEDDKVFSGNVTMTSNEWTLITFDKPFVYDGTSNLALIVDDNTGSYTSAPHMSCRTYYYNGDNQAIYVYNDGTNYNPNSPSAYNGMLMNEKNQVYFGFSNIDCWPPVNLTATDITTNSATLHWEGYQDNYNVRYRVAPPFYEDFEDEESFYADWTFISMNNANDVGVNVNSAGVFSEAYNGVYGFRFSSYHSISTGEDYNQYLVSPKLTVTGELKFYFKKYNNSTESLYVGYSTTGNDIDDFTWTEDLAPTTSWQEYTQTLPSNVKYIAFHYYGNYTFHVYLDDITIGGNGIPLGNWETVYNVTGTTTEISGLDPSTNYVWQVQGNNANCNDNGSTKWSKKATFITQCDAIIVDAENPFTEDFEGDWTPLCWENIPYIDGTTTRQWTKTTSSSNIHTGAGAAYSGYYGPIYLVMPELQLTSNASEASLSFWSYNTYPDDFDVGNNTVVLLDGDMETVLWSAETVSEIWEENTIDLTAYLGQTVTLAFKYAGDNGNGWYVDDVEVAVTNTYIFLTNGNWNNGSCWNTGTVPPAGSDVIIQANATVPAGYLAVANAVSLEGGSITVADGGQLRHNTSDLVVTMQKNIEGYDDVNGKGNYYLLAFPFFGMVEVPSAMTANEGSDFYDFDPNFQDAEWRNDKQTPINYVYRYAGYLYASPESFVLSVTGSTYALNTETSWDHVVEYTEGSANPYNGWELLGNPFTYNAYVYAENGDELVPMEVMIYDENGDLQTITCGPVAPMQGFFVHVTETTTVCFRGEAHINDYVDLGLPSGLLWATCNVGANAPEEYGDYFAWGETMPKDVYKWDTYQYGDGSTFTKYSGSDGLTTLLPEDDAATANWGSSWRMPTVEDWEELYNNTTVTWTTQNGVNGQLFTGSNGNSLFLPAAGYRYLSDLYDAGSSGYYWSSSLVTDNPDIAWDLYFGLGDCAVNGCFRYYGPSVRAVRVGSQN